MPRGVITHVGLIVQDLERSVEEWTKVLSLVDPASLEVPPIYLEGEIDGVKTRTATFVNPYGCEIQLMSPQDEYAYSQFGTPDLGHEYVHHIAFATPNPQDALERAQAAGLKTTGRGFDDDVDATLHAKGIGSPGEWFMIPMADGHTLVEVHAPYRPKNGKWERLGEEWTPELQLPEPENR